MKFQYECPDFDCGYEIEVEDGDKQAVCKHCGRGYAMSWDATFEGGRWIDLTILVPLKEVDIE